MAAGVIPNEGMKWIIDVIKGTPGLKVRTFKNNLAVQKSSTLLDFNTSTFGGYADKVPVFGASALDVAPNYKATAAILTWTTNITGAAESIFGWVLFDSVSLKMIAGRLLTTPVVMTTINSTYSLTLSELQGDLP